jgi:hypothetical protein
MEKSRHKSAPADEGPTKRWWGDNTDRIALITLSSALFIGVIVYLLYWLGIVASPLQAITKLYLVVLAFLLSFFIVAHLRQPEAPVEIRGLGFSLKGSAGRTILWILCFLVIVGAMHIAGLL